jgi:hypothetical protein
MKCELSAIFDFISYIDIIKYEKYDLLLHSPAPCASLTMGNSTARVDN